MSGEKIGNNSVLIEDDIQSSMIKQTLESELMATQWVDWLNEFDKGSSNFRIPSIGKAQVEDYAGDGEALKFRPLDKGEFVMNIDQFKQSGNFITKDAQEDLHYASQLVASIAPSQTRAIAEELETNIMKLQGEQTTGATNLINGGKHRYAATGASNTIGVEDFARANLSFNLANVSANNRIAIVHPSVAYTLETLTNLTNVSNNPHFEGVVAEGMTSGMRFVKNVYGFDVYVSNFVDIIEAETLETVNCAGFAANMFIGANGEEGPFKGAWARMPVFKSWEDHDREITKYSTTSRYGTKLYRDESLIVVPSNIAV